MRSKIKNVICFLADKKTFWSIMLLYVFIKLLPIIAFDNRFTKAIVIISFFILIIRLIKLVLYDKKIIVNKYRVSTILFFIICIFSVFYNIGFNILNFSIKNPEYNIIVVLFVNLFVLFSIDANNNYKEDLKYLKIILFIISIFSFFNLIFSIIDAVINNRDRIWGLTNSVWSFTHFVAISFAINLYLLICEKKLGFKIFYIISIILDFIVLIFVQQRAGYLCLFIGVIFSIIFLIVTGRIFIFKDCIARNKKMLIIFIIVLIVSVLFLNSYIDLKVIYGKLLNFSTGGRSQIIKISFDKLLEYKSVLFGLIGNFHYLNIDDKSRKMQILISEVHFHNIFFCILMCFGVFAFIVFVIFVFQIVAKLFSLFKYAKNNSDIFNLIIFSFFGVLGSLIAGFFDDNMIINLPYLSNLVFFILSSIICSIDAKR